MKPDKLTRTNIQRIISAHGKNANDASWEIYTLYLEALEKYSQFLEDNGYMDNDWRIEQPLAIDEFLKRANGNNISKNK